MIFQRPFWLPTLQRGTPSITVFNPAPGGGTTSSVTLTVSQVVVTPTLRQPTCFAKGKIDIAVSGGTAPYSYVWSDLASTINVQNRIGLTVGTYSVTVTDANGCSASSGNLVLNDPGPCNGMLICQSDVAAIVLTNPDPANTSYVWTVPAGAVINSGQGTSSISLNMTGLAVGQYQICVSGISVCGTSAPSCKDIYITKPDIMAYADPVCSGDALNLYAFGGVSYAWTGPNGFTSVQQFPVIYNATSVNSGTYTVTTTDENGCSATTTVSVSINTAPTITGTVTSSTCGNSDGAVSISLSGGSGYTYSWSTGDVTQNLSNISSGSYTVTVFNSTGCSTTKTFSVNDTGGPTVSLASSTNVSCYGGNNGAINLTITGGSSPYSYSWSNSETTQNITGLYAGTYSVVVTDAAGCNSGLTIDIAQPLGPIQGSGATTNVVTFGASTGAIALTVTGGTSAYTYSWAASNGGIVPSGQATSQNLTTLKAGTYSVVVTDSKGCTLTKSFTVTQPGSALSASASVINVSCNGGSNGIVTLSVTGGTTPYTYSWIKSSGGFFATTQSIINLSAATYTVTVTDKNGITTTASATVTQPVILSLSAVVTNVSCYGSSTGSIALTTAGGTAPYTYRWSNGPVTKNISALPVGSYNVTVTDANVCTATGNYTVTQPTQLTASIIGTTQSSCYGGANGTATAAGSGGTAPYTYSWNTSPIQTNATVTGLSAGTVYTVTVTDSKGCTASALATVSQPTAISVASFATEVSCFGGSNGAINLTPTGGTSPYTYNWGGGITTQNRTGLIAGTYNVTITDALGCTSAKSYTITQPAALTASSVATNVTCNAAHNGSINLTVGGGTAPYTYAWSNAASSQNLTGLAPGTYSVTVTDALGCTATSSATITQPAVLTVSGVITDNCSGQSNGSIVLTVTGGTAGYSYAWSNSATTQNLSGLASGTYSVTVTDSKGCTASASFTLASMTVSLTSFPVSCVYFGDPTMYGIIGDGQIYPTISNGTAPFTYAWTGSRNSYSSSNSFISGLSWGNYSLTVTDANGCTYTTSTTLDAPSCNPPVANPDNFTSCGGAVVSGNVATNDTDTDFPTGPFEVNPLGYPTPDQGSINWDNSYNGAFTFTPAANYSGTVTINYQISDPKNLTATGILTIYVSAMSAAITAADTHNIVCGATNGSATVTVTGGITPFTYSWNTSPVQNTATATALAAGTYVVTVTDAKNCTITASATIKNVCMTFAKTLHSVNGNTLATTFNTVGDVIAYDIVVTNTGTADLSNVVVTDPKTGLNQTILSLTAGSSQTITTSYTVQAADMTAGSFTNTSSANFTYNSVPYTYSDSETIGAGAADLSIAKSVITSPVVSGGELIYMIVVTNHGPAPARNVEIADIISAFPNPTFSTTLGGTYTAWSNPYTVPVQIANGATYTLYIKGILAAAQCSAVTNSATVSSSNDNNSANNGTGTITTTVLDRTSPTFTTCPAAISQPVNNNCTLAALNLGVPTATDNCSAVTFTNNAPTSFPMGATIVTWTATDASGNTATCTQTVTVTNAAPTATADSYSTLQSTGISGNVLLNDSDPEGQSLTVTNWGNPSHGSLSSTTTGGVFIYTPTGSYTGSDSFTYTITDACGLTASGTVTINIETCVAPPTIPGPIKVTK